MTAPISLILVKTRGHRPRLQMLLHELCNILNLPDSSASLHLICQRLKLSNAEREHVEWLVEKHQFLCDARKMRLSKLKTTLAHPGIRELLDLHRADALASSRSIDHVEYCEQLLREWSPADLNPPPLLTGDDLKAERLEPGPLFKRLLDALREAQLEGIVKTREEARKLLERLIQELV